jgi:hypothetical protein
MAAIGLILIFKVLIIDCASAPVFEFCDFKTFALYSVGPLNGGAGRPLALPNQ